MRWRGKSFLPEKQNVFNTKRSWNRGFTSLEYSLISISYWHYLTPTSAPRETKMLLCSFTSTKLTKADKLLSTTFQSKEESLPRQISFLLTDTGWISCWSNSYILSGKRSLAFFYCRHPEDLLGKTTILKHSCGNNVQNQLINNVKIFFQNKTITDW